MTPWAPKAYPGRRYRAAWCPTGRPGTPGQAPEPAAEALDQAVAGQVKVEPGVGVPRVQGGDEGVHERGVRAALLEDVQAPGDLPSLPRLVSHVVPVDAGLVAAVTDDAVACAAPVRRHLCTALSLRPFPWPLRPDGDHLLDRLPGDT